MPVPTFDEFLKTRGSDIPTFDEFLAQNSVPGAAKTGIPGPPKAPVPAGLQGPPTGDDSISKSLWNSVGQPLVDVAKLTPPALAFRKPQAVGNQVADTLTGLSDAVVRKPWEYAQNTGDAMIHGDIPGVVRNAPGMVPLFGPQVEHAADELDKGNWRNAVGESVGVVGQAAAPEIISKGGPIVANAAGKIVSKTAELPEVTADALRASGEKQYNQVLGPTTRPNKFQAKRVVGGYDAPAPELGPGATVPVPGLIDRGVTAMTRNSLAKKLNAAVSTTGDQLEAAWGDLPGDAMVPADRVYSAIDQNLNKEFTQVAPDGSMAPTGPDSARGLKFGQSLKDYLQSHEVQLPDGSTGITYDSLRTFRQDWDGMVAAAKGFSGADLTTKVNAQAYRSASDGIRDIINGDNPSVSKINREFSFWKNASDVMNATQERTTGQAKPLGRKMARVVGQGMGFAGGGIGGAVLSGEAMDAVEGIITSPGWKTVSAVLKNRLANAISSQSTQQISQAVGAAQAAIGPERQLGPGSFPFTQGTSVPDLSGIRRTPYNAGLLSQGESRGGSFTRPAIITPPPPDTSYVSSAGLAPHQQVNVSRLSLPRGTAPFTQGTIVPEILGRPGQATGKLLSSPRAGQPPLNVLPRGPASVQGPPYMPSSAGHPIPLPAQNMVFDPATGQWVPASDLTPPGPLQ